MRVAALTGLIVVLVHTVLNAYVVNVDGIMSIFLKNRFALLRSPACWFSSKRSIDDSTSCGDAFPVDLPS